jgi:hypothetical protein
MSNRVAVEYAANNWLLTALSEVRVLAGERQQGGRRRAEGGVKKKQLVEEFGADATIESIRPVNMGAWR